MNWAFFPFAILAERPAKGVNKVTYQDEYIDPETGKTIPLKVTITGAATHGLPTIQDETVLLAFLYLTCRDGFTQPLVSFTRLDLFQVLGWPDTGHSYQRLKTALRRWKGVTITFENWWDHRTGQYTTEQGISILATYVLRDGRRRYARTDEQPELQFGDHPPLLGQPSLHSQCSITWSAEVFSNLQNRYLKPLDLERYLSLPTAPAKRAYRYLDKDLPGQGQPQIYDLSRFACQHVGFSPDYKPSLLRTKVQSSVVKPLEEAKFIETMAAKHRFPKRDGRLCVVFARKDPPPAFPAHDQSAPPPLPLPPGTGQPAEQPSSPADSPLFAELKHFGVGGKAARDFIADHPAGYIEQKIDFLAFLIDTGKSPKNHAGWLRRALEEDYGPPSGYLPLEERQRLHKAAEDKERQKQEADRQKEAQRRQEEQKLAAHKAERAHIDAYLKALTPEEHKALEEQALANADARMDALREASKGHDSMSKIARGLLVDREVLRIHPLPQQQPAS